MQRREGEPVKYLIWDPKICVAEFDEDTACKKYKIHNKWGLLVTDSGDGRLSQIILFHQEPTLLSSLLSAMSCRLEISHWVWLGTTKQK